VAGGSVSHCEQVSAAAEGGSGPTRSTCMWVKQLRSTGMAAGWSWACLWTLPGWQNRHALAIRVMDLAICGQQNLAPRRPHTRVANGVQQLENRLAYLCGHQRAKGPQLGVGIKTDATGIWSLRPVREHSSAGLGPRIPVPDWFQRQHFCLFR